ncbi:sialidase family protein [Haloferula sargassicola]|uniref:Sialidase domain-containing protein n=1 Tax=Haloferula sargassicola TaxID=490096 RepID=A0ABP9UX97_9BACT
MLWVGIAPAAEIEWKPQTRVLIAEGGGYGRIARVGEERLLCAYSRRGAIEVRGSADDGKTWSRGFEAGRWEHGQLTNAELLVRSDGEVWCFFNRRPSRRSPEAAKFSVGFFRSRDQGVTWSAPEMLYEAGHDFGNGCWEPAGIELPDGRVQVYFANEGPYRESNEQEITMVATADGGKSWAEPQTVSFRAGSRDGMPVPTLLPEVGGIAVAIEDNGLGGAFKPVILGTSWTGSWSGGPVEGESRQRWSALREPLAAKTYAGAPYLRWLRRGVTVLSFQLAESGDMADSRMAVCLGNGRARDFGEPAFPFPEGEGQLWNSLFVKNEHTITAVTQARIDGRAGVWAIDGEVGH